MTAEETKDVIEKYIKCTNSPCPNDDDDLSCAGCESLITENEWDEALKTAIKILEKQVPEKPMISVDVKNSCHLYCPSCGMYIGTWNKRARTIDMHNKTNAHICAQCGRAIDCSIERLEE